MVNIFSDILHFYNLQQHQEQKMFISNWDQLFDRVHCDTKIGSSDWDILQIQHIILFILAHIFCTK